MQINHVENDACLPVCYQSHFVLPVYLQPGQKDPVRISQDSASRVLRVDSDALGFFGDFFLGGGALVLGLVQAEGIDFWINEPSLKNP